MIEPYYERGGIVLYCGDNREAMPHLEPESISAVVTDPPYGLSFMSRDWDHNVPGVRFWELISATMKPGAHLLSFGGTRTSHRMVCAIEDAGFEIRDSFLYWGHGQGFPKGNDFAADMPASRKAGCRIPKPEFIGTPFESGWNVALKPAYEPICVARKPLIGTVAANVLAHGTGAINVDASRIEGVVQSGAGTTGFGAGRDDGYTRGTGREYTAQGRWPPNVILGCSCGPVMRLSAIISPEDRLIIWRYFNGSPESRSTNLPILQSDVHHPKSVGTEGASEVLLTGLRASEHGNTARRDGVSTRHDDITGSPSKHQGGSASSRRGTGEEGATSGELAGRSLQRQGWLLADSCGELDGGGTDDSRADADQNQVRLGASIGDGEEGRTAARARRGGSSPQRRQDGQQAGQPRTPDAGTTLTEAQRHDLRDRKVEAAERDVVIPAHMVPGEWLGFFERIERGNDPHDPDCPAAILDQQSGVRPSPQTYRRSRAASSVLYGAGMGDKPEGQEATNYGDSGGASRFMTVLPIDDPDTVRFLYTPKASRAERNAGLPEGMTNGHPTVKNLALMEWLLTLVSPPGAIILDPFAGSGSTLVAAARLGITAIGIEMDESYAEIAAKKIDYALDQRAKRARQPRLVAD